MAREIGDSLGHGPPDALGWEPLRLTWRRLFAAAAGVGRLAPALAGLSAACTTPAERSPGALPAATPAAIAARAQALVPELEPALRENVLAFWLPRCLDREHGGYQLDYGPAGEPLPPGPRLIVGQARMLWFFARLARTQGGGPALLDAAALGYRFLRDRLWDDEHGGFYWAVAADGGAVPMPDKHLYGQAFALYALSEYFLASGQAEALDLAHRLFDVLEARAHDDHHGGYHQFFRRDWSPPAPDVPSYRGAPGLKSLDTHLHLLEALTTYTQATGRVAAQRRLTELILIQSSAVVRKEGPVCTEAYEPDWTPRLEGAHGRVLYGHLLQNAWLLLEACDVAGLPSAPLVDLCGALFAAAVRAGYDEPRGGFYVSGPLRGPADERAKVWWVQAEALASALRLYQATQHAAYFAIFEKTWEFVRRYQIDWTHGEWHATLSPSGGSSGAKGSNWKTAYHNGRALMNCLAWLRALA